VLTYATTIIGPDARQLAAGQLWSACVLTYGSTGEILPQTVRGVVQGGKVPAELSSCTAGGATVVRAPASCAAKHSVEVLAENDDQTATVQSLSRSCQELAARETGRASIADTAGLTVEVTIVVLTIDGPRLAPAVPSDLPSTTWCAIRADNGRSLTDSLRGVGDAAIPWAN
jgi:hypothetical protein